MGYHTTFEFAHDFFPERVKADPIGFANLMLEVARAGSARRPEVDTELSHFGVRVGPTRHSSEAPLIPYCPHQPRPNQTSGT